MFQEDYIIVNVLPSLVLSWKLPVFSVDTVILIPRMNIRFRFFF